MIQFSHGLAEARHGWKIPCNGDGRAEDCVEGSGADRAEADRARALLLTLDGWTSARIAQAFGVREDTVRLWRSDFVRGAAVALRLGFKRPRPALQQDHVVHELDRNRELSRRRPMRMTFLNKINNALTKLHRKWLAHQ